MGNRRAPVVGSRNVTGMKTEGSRAKVYFTRTIDAEHLIRLYGLVNESIYGRTAIKLHTGEQHGPNILPRDMVRAFQATVPDSAIVETNTLYEGDRDTTEKHRKTLEVNGWTFCPVDILAVDQACCDLVFGMEHGHNHDLVERIESRHGLRQLTAMAELRMGNPCYELIEID